MEYTVEIGSSAMIYIQSLIKIGSGIQKLMRRKIQTAWWSHKPVFITLK
jgi:hypothetical protein